MKSNTQPKADSACTCLALLLLLAVAGCGSQPDQQSVLQPVVTTEFSTEVQPGQPDISFPRLPAAAAEPGVFKPWRYGADFAADLGINRVSGDLSQGLFEPGNSEASGSLNDSAYALYRMRCFNESTNTVLALEWDGVPPAGSDCWIGVSYWQEQRWIWAQLPETGRLNLWADAVANEFHQTYVALIVTGGASSRLKRISLECEPDGTDSFTLFAPMRSTETYLINMDGLIVKTWDSDFGPGFAVYMLDNGHILRTCDMDSVVGLEGRIEEYDWEGNLVWYFEDFTPEYDAHHDIQPMPNGNILVVAYQIVASDDAIAAGRDADLLDTDELWLDSILEIKPGPDNTGEIVWIWNVFDHVVQDFNSDLDNYGEVSENPQLLDINFDSDGNADFTHANGVDYNPELDQVVISFRGTDEFYVIDHSTTTEEAAGHTGGRSGMGGDILYRWGNPQAYGHGDATARQLFKQHDSEWIRPGCPGAGNFTVFDNGWGRPGGVSYSRVLEIAPPVDAAGNYTFDGGAFEPPEAGWAFVADPPGSMFSAVVAGAQRLPNGNTVVCEGTQGRFLEVTQGGEIVWEYQNLLPSPTTNMVFKVERYQLFGPDFQLAP